MSFYGPSAPAIRLGADNLPHCSRCTEEATCQFHTNQVEAALRSLVSQYLLAAAQVDLRFVIRGKTRVPEA